MNPDVCGGGVFVLRGVEREIGPLHGGASGIATTDSRAGNSVGVLIEGGGDIGPVHVAVGYKKLGDAPTGESDSTKLLFVGRDFGKGPVKVSVGGFAGVTNKKSPFQLGGYVSAAGRGGGAYVNLVPGGQCSPHQ